MSSTKVFVFYNKEDRDVYAWTENRVHATLFELTRDMKKYLKKEIRLEDVERCSFEAWFKSKMLFKNVLTDGKESYDFITTYEENDILEVLCDKTMDRAMELELAISQLPLSDEFRKDFDDLISYRKEKEGRYGKYNSFNVFITGFHVLVE